MKFTKTVLLTLIWSFMTITAGYADKCETDRSCEVWPFTINCPPNVTLSCTDEIWNLSAYGNATYTSYYGTYSAGAPVVQYFLNNCNTGYITRTWMVEDYNWVWHSCTQTIYISSGGYGGGIQVQWPENYVVSGCNPNIHPSVLPAPHGYPTWTSSPCSMIGRSYSDMTFYVNNSCKKVLRTWKLMDWCTYNPSYPNSGGLWTYVQEIKIMESSEPVVNCVPEIVANSHNCKNAYVEVAPLYVSPSSCGGDFEITNNSPYSTYKGANISGTYPIGTTKVSYTIKFGCGSKKICNVNVIVKNAAKPTPYCLGHIITTLMPVDTDKDGIIDNGMVELWAKDLDKGSKAPCGFNPLRFSFEKDSIVMNRMFTCEDIGKNEVRMYVTDSKGGQSFCQVTVEIQNNANIPDCKPKPPVVPPPVVPASRSVKGNITDAWGVALEDAEISLTYTTPETIINIIRDTMETIRLDSFKNASGYWVYRHFLDRVISETRDTQTVFHTIEILSDTNGKFLFDSLKVTNKEFEIKALYQDTFARKYINGKDAEALTQFLLGEKAFDSPYQYLAADIDENGVIDLQDLNSLMQFVTKQTNSLPGENNWFIFNKDQDFDPAVNILSDNLFSFISMDSVPALGALYDVGFVAVRKGDIVQSVVSDFLPQVSDITGLRSKSELLESSVNLYPNPFDKILNIRLVSEEESTAIIKLYNNNGQIIWQYNLNVVKGVNEMTVTPEINYSGLIMYQIISGNKVSSGTLIKM
ncbi:MAG: T9SS type A sorting domain-containing protein [Saprospiraceae bacterium]|nr:T9SS type A sorting domain-containing protein [Saprospiraceae bacterium]